MGIGGQPLLDTTTAIGLMAVPGQHAVLLGINSRLLCLPKIDLPRIQVRPSEEAAIGREGDAPGPEQVPAKSQGLLARDGIPDADATIRLEETRRRPSALKATSRTGPVCPAKTTISSPVTESQIRTVQSSLAKATRWPSGLNVTLVRGAVWPVKRRISWLVATSQILTV
jgi:hypothetical protein